MFVPNQTIVEVVDLEQDPPCVLVAGLLVELHERLVGIRYWHQESGKLRYAEFPRTAQFAVREVTDCAGEEGLYAYLAMHGSPTLTMSVRDRALLLTILQHLEGVTGKRADIPAFSVAANHINDCDFLRGYADGKTNDESFVVGALIARISAIIAPPTAADWIWRAIADQKFVAWSVNAAINRCEDSGTLIAFCLAIPIGTPTDRKYGNPYDAVAVLQRVPHFASVRDGALARIWRDSLNEEVRRVVAYETTDPQLLHNIARSDQAERLRALAAVRLKSFDD